MSYRHHIITSGQYTLLIQYQHTLSSHPITTGANLGSSQLNNNQMSREGGSTILSNVPMSAQGMRDQLHAQLNNHNHNVHGSGNGGPGMGMGHHLGHGDRGGGGGGGGYDDRNNMSSSARGNGHHIFPGNREGNNGGGGSNQLSSSASYNSRYLTTLLALVPKQMFYWFLLSFLCLYTSKTTRNYQITSLITTITIITIITTHSTSMSLLEGEDDDNKNDDFVDNSLELSAGAKPFVPKFSMPGRSPSSGRSASDGSGSLVAGSSAFAGGGLGLGLGFSTLGGSSGGSVGVGVGHGLAGGITTSPILTGLPGGSMSSILIPPINSMLNNHMNNNNTSNNSNNNNGSTLSSSSSGRINSSGSYEMDPLMSTLRYANNTYKKGELILSKQNMNTSYDHSRLSQYIETLD